MKTIGVSDFIAKKFDIFPFEGEWKESFGGNKEFVIWNSGKKIVKQVDLFNQE